MHEGWNNIVKFERFVFLVLVKHDEIMEFSETDENEYQKLYAELKEALK